MNIHKKGKSFLSIISKAETSKENTVKLKYVSARATELPQWTQQPHAWVPSLPDALPRPHPPPPAAGGQLPQAFSTEEKELYHVCHPEPLLFQTLC